MTRCSDASGRHLVGDPIDVVTGANTFREVDFELAAGPLELTFYRHYDSRWSGEDRGLGHGFRHGFDTWLVFHLDGITYVEADGTERHFPHLVYDGERKASAGCWLERVSAERYEVTRHAKPTLVFRRPARAKEAELVEQLEEADGRLVRVLFEYDDAGRLENILAPSDETLHLEWDASGHLHGVQRRGPDGQREWMARYRYASGYLVEATDYYGHAFRLGYEPSGRVSQRIDRRGFTFLFEYDERGRCVSSAGEDGTLAVQLTYEPTAFETRVLDANAAEWVYQYDRSGAVVLITDPYGGVRYFKTGDDGRLLREYDSKGACTTYVHDDAGAAVAKIDPHGNRVALPEDPAAPGPDDHRLPRLPIEWELGDRWERGFRLPDPHELPFDLPPDVRQALTTSDDPRRGTVEEERDLSGHRQREVLETGQSRDYAYNENGGLATVTDMRGGTWNVEVSGWNDITGERDPLGGRTTYAYSSTRAQTEVVDAAGTTTEMRRDLKDRVTEIRRNGQLVESYCYDPADHLVEKRDANGELLLELERDTTGRVVERKLGSGEQHSLRYDDRGRLIEAHASHHLCTFAYDYADRRTADLRDGEGVIHRYVGGELARTAVLERFVTRYHRLAGGTCVLVDPTGATHRLRSHGRGVFTRDFANGLSETTQYHPRGGRPLAKVLHAKDEPGHAWARRYVYDAEGNLEVAIDSEAGPTRHEHDAALRLAKTTHPDGRVDNYQYNAAGTLFRSPTIGQGTAGELNQLRYANGEQYEHNERGHLSRRTSARGQVHYDYDSRDQLSVVFWEGPNGERWGWDAEYDALGRRIRKAPGYTNDTHYYWDGDRLAAEVFHDGSLRAYVYADDFAMVPLLFVDYASVDAEPSSGERFYVLADQRGCVERVLDDAGDVVWKARVDAYGVAHVEVGQEFHQPLRFPGHFHDPELALHYNRFRYYDPTLGRYLSPDPLGLRGGLNLYAYTRTPLTQVDLRGLSHDPHGTADDGQPRTPGDDAEGEGQAGTHHPSEAASSQPRERGSLVHDPARANPSAARLAQMDAAHGKARAAEAMQESRPSDRSTVAINGGTHRSGYNTERQPTPGDGFTNGPGRDPRQAAAHDRAIGHEPHANESMDPRLVTNPDGSEEVHGASTWETDSEGNRQRVGSQVEGGQDAGHAERQMHMAQNDAGTNDPGGVGTEQCGGCRAQARQHARDPSRPHSSEPVVLGDPEHTRVYNSDGTVDVYRSSTNADGTVSHEYQGTAPSDSEPRPRPGARNYGGVPW